MKPGGFVLSIGGGKHSPPMGDDDDEAPPSSKPGDAGDDKDSMMESAAEDLIDAVKGGDAKAVVAAFKDLCDLHGGYDDEDDDGK